MNGESRPEGRLANHTKRRIQDARAAAMAALLANVVVPFGRHFGRTIPEIHKGDVDHVAEPRYVRWLSDGNWKHIDGAVEEAVRRAASAYLRRREAA
jgi:hypothetical protein